MWKKNILHLFHQTKLCNNSCSLKYPWGWKDKSLLKKLIFNNSKKNSICDFNHVEFINNTIYPYNLIYKSYLNNIDFLDYEYTNPSLSIALNKLRNNIDEGVISKLPKEIILKKNIILNNKISNSHLTCNSKFLGYFSKNQILNEIAIGMIGPEISHIWNEKPTKQTISVLYESESFYDILEWERDLTLDNPEWQVSNINYII